MKRLTVTALLGFGIILIGSLYASPEFYDVIISAYKIPSDSKLADRSCGICHVSDSDFKLNPYGKDLAKVMLAEDTSDISASLLRKIDGLDSDGDGFSNGDELKSGFSPGDGKDRPPAPPTPPPTAPTKNPVEPAKTPPTKEPKPPAATGETPVAEPSDEEATTEGPPDEPEPDAAEEAVESDEETASRSRGSIIPKNAYHPAIVHFPIALFVAGLFLDFLGLVSKRKELLLAGWYNLVIAAVTAVGAILTGFGAIAFTKIPMRGMIQEHAIYAVVAAFAMWAMVSLRVHRHEEMNIPVRLLYYALAFVGLGTIVWAGHLGGVFVYGR